MAFQEINEREKRFAENYLVCGVAAKAAREAGYNPTMAKSAYKILKRPRVQRYLSQIISKNIADEDEILATLTTMLRRDTMIKAMGSKKTTTTTYADNKKQSVTVTIEPMLIDSPIKISEATKAAELLGKIYGLFSDKGPESDTRKGTPVIIYDYNKNNKKQGEGKSETCENENDTDGSKANKNKTNSIKQAKKLIEAVGLESTHQPNSIQNTTQKATTKEGWEHGEEARQENHPS